MLRAPNAIPAASARSASATTRPAGPEAGNEERGSAPHESEASDAQAHRSLLHPHHRRGPIVIGQACEFDYSGTQACKALREEGYRIILVNSNPATIMTDPDLADATYVEPITPEIVARIIEKERPDALLPTMGGQTALNCALSLKRMGVLEKFGVQMIGATAEAIDKAEDRSLFRDAMTKIGLETPKSALANASAAKKADREKYLAEVARIEAAEGDEASRKTALAAFEKKWASGENDRRKRYGEHALGQALVALAEVGLPAIIRPSFTMGGTGGGIAYNREEFLDIVERGIDASPTNEVLIEESVLGWKEYEMEVVRDRADNCIIVCSIENVDPMGVHTGDSITVAPALTLTDKEYQRMRDASLAVLREIGVETGGSNVQFAVDPATGRMIVIEMNPRVSRSSALASKATGFPIAKVAAKLAVGYTLDEIANDITGGATPASFEPTIDYVVTKIPRFAFEKFPGAEPTLTTAMKSVGEAMAIGRTFAESLQKALRSLETGLTGLDDIEIEGLGKGDDRNAIKAAIGTPTPDRLLKVAQALRLGVSHEEVHASCKIDPWFLEQLQGIIDLETKVKRFGLPKTAGAFRQLKAAGFSDTRSPCSPAWTRAPCAPPAGRCRCGRSSSGSTPARPSSSRRPPTCTRPTWPRSPGPWPTRPSPRTPRRSSSSAAARTGSARASSSTIAAATPASRSPTRATRPSWSTATRRRCRPTTTPRTGSISSR